MGVRIGAQKRAETFKIVPIKVSNGLQRIYHEINSQLIFLIKWVFERRFSDIVSENTIMEFSKK